MLSLLDTVLLLLFLVIFVLIRIMRHGIIDIGVLEGYMVQSGDRGRGCGYTCAGHAFDKAVVLTWSWSVVSSIRYMRPPPPT